MANKRRFLLDTNTQKEDLLSIKVSKKTVYAENSAVNALREYLGLQSPSLTLEELELPELDDVLANFFPHYEKAMNITRGIHISLYDRVSIAILGEFMEKAGSI